MAKDAEVFVWNPGWDTALEEAHKAIGEVRVVPDLVLPEERLRGEQRDEEYVRGNPFEIAQTPEPDRHYRHLAKDEEPDHIRIARLERELEELRRERGRWITVRAIIGVLAWGAIMYVQVHLWLGR